MNANHSQHPPLDGARHRGFPDAWDLGMIALLAVALGIVVLLPFGPNRLGDMDFYVEAKALAAALKGTGDGQAVAITKAPGPVLYYLLPFLAVPARSPAATFWLAGVIWSGLWMAVALLLIRRAAALLAGRSGGLLGVGLLLAVPFVVYYATGILAEPPAFLGAALFVYGWTSAWKRHEFGASGWRALLLCGGGAALLCLSRPNALPLVPLGFLYWAVLRRSVQPLWRASATAAGAVIGVTTALALGILVLAGHLPGRRPAGQQGSYLAYVVFQGRFQYRQEPWNWAYWDERRAGTPDYDQWLNDGRQLAADAKARGISLTQARWAWIRQDWQHHPLLALRMTAMRCVTMNLAVVHSATPEAFRVGPVPGRWVFLALHAGLNAVGLGMLAAALFALRAVPKCPMLGMLAVPYFSLLGFSALTYGEPRYLFAGQPGLAVLATLALTPALAATVARLKGASCHGA